MLKELYHVLLKKARVTEKIYNYTLDIGLNDKNTLKQEITTEKAIQIIKDNTFSVCGGYTLRQCDGAYTMNSGEAVQEKSIQLDIKYTTQKKIYELIEILKVELNQESIGLKVERVKYLYA